MKPWFEGEWYVVFSTMSGILKLPFVLYLLHIYGLLGRLQAFVCMTSYIIHQLTFSQCIIYTCHYFFLLYVVITDLIL